MSAWSVNAHAQSALRGARSGSLHSQTAREREATSGAPLSATLPTSAAVQDFRVLTVRAAVGLLLAHP